MKKTIFFGAFILGILVFGVMSTSAWFSSDAHSNVNRFSTGTWVAPSLGVVINEAFCRTDSSHGEDGKNEWLELYNAGSAPVNLKDWQIAGGNEIKTINANQTLAPQEFLLIAHDASTWRYWTVPEQAQKINFGKAPTNWLAESASTIVLKDSAGQIINEFNYSSCEAGKSWERNPRGSGNPVESTTPTPGS